MPVPRVLAIEADESDPCQWIDIKIPEYSELETAYHVQILSEAGFIDAVELTDFDGYDWKAKRMTYDGHEFLDTVRDGEIWKLTKETGKEAGIASLQALFEIGKSIAKQKLVEHGIHLG